MKRKLVMLAAVVALGVGTFAHARETTTATTPTRQPPSSTAPAAQNAPTPTDQTATPSTPALPAGIDPPPEGMGQVVFFRPSGFVGMALTFTVRENDVALGSLPNGHYLVQPATPGIHTYEIGHNDSIRLEIEPGVTYYAIESTQMGIIAGRAVLSPSDRATFEAAFLQEPPPKTTDVAQAILNNQGALIVDFPRPQCAWQSHEVININSGQTYRTNNLVGPSGHVLLAIVPPGIYAYVDGECRFTSPSYYAVTNPYIGSGHMVYRDNRLNNPYLRYWLRPVTVAAGEVVYSGTITEEQLHYEYGIALTVLERLHGRRARSTVAFPIYGLEDNAETVRADLEHFSETLSSRFVSRVGAVRFERSAARTIADNAFAPIIPVIPPNEAAATSNRDAALARASAALRAGARESLVAEFPQGAPRPLANLFADE